MKYHTLKKLEDGSYYASISTDSDQPLIIQVNNLTVPEGTLDGDDLWFDVGEGDSELSPYEDEILTEVKSNPEKWFNKKVREKTIESSWQSHLSQHGTFQVTKSRMLKIFNKDTQEEVVGIDSPQDTCDILVQIQGLQFLKKSFGMVLKLHQIQVTPIVEEPKEVNHDDWVMDEYGFAD